MDTYSFKVAGTSYRQNQIQGICKDYVNPEYQYSKKELLEECLEDTRIYKYDCIMYNVTLQPEPDNKYDPNAIKILVEGIHIGYVPKEKCASVKKILASGQIASITCIFCGGPYKILNSDDSSMEHDDLTIGAKIEIEYGTVEHTAVKQPEKKGMSEGLKAFLIVMIVLAAIALGIFIFIQIATK